MVSIAGFGFYQSRIRNTANQRKNNGGSSYNVAADGTSGAICSLCPSER